MLKSYLFIAHTEKMGRGVFTKKEIPANTIIESAPVIVMSAEDRKLIDQTLLHDYIFEWGEQNERCCMALGMVPIYNHSYHSNCEYYMDFDSDMIVIKTVREIEKGEELTINYNGDYNSEKKVWFETL